MPVHAERITPELYRVHWVGVVTVDDLFNARDAIDVMMTEDQVSRYVLLIDGSQTKMVPFDLRMTINALNPGCLGVMVLNAPFAGELLGRMFNAIMPIQAKFFRDRDLWM